MPQPPVTPSLDDIEALARTAFAGLPEEFRALTGDVVFMVRDFPDRDTLADLDIEDRYELLGLFHGAPFSAHAANAAGPDPTMIFLYRKPILRYWRDTGEELSAIVRNVLIHEIGHHFGLSDEDMDAIEAAAN